MIVDSLLAIFRGATGVKVLSVLVKYPLASLSVSFIHKLGHKGEWDLPIVVWFTNMYTI